MGGRWSQLNTPPERKSVGDDLDATFILALGDNIEVAHTYTCCDRGPSFATNPSGCTRELAEDARTGARRNVVAQGIMSKPTTALCACEKHSEKGGIER